MTVPARPPRPVMRFLGADHGFGPQVSIGPEAVVHDTALIHGKVAIARGASVWPYAVIRAEADEVTVGEETNLQDFVMVHVGSGTPTHIGARCSITHHVNVHGATIGDDCLIGINATVMDGAEIGAGSIVAGHSIVTEGAKFPENSIIAGVPAKLIATRDNREANRRNAEFYRLNARAYVRGIHRKEDWPADL